MCLNHGLGRAALGRSERGSGAPILRTVCVCTPPGYTVRGWKQVAAHGPWYVRTVFRVFVT